MAISHLLEDFGTGPADTDDADEAAEDQRLAVFEQGYSAGWDDAIAAQARDHARATGALARSLEDISFTYHEVLSQMLALVDPVFRALVDKVLPATLHSSLGDHLVEELRRMAGDQAAQPVEIVLSPGEGAAVRPVLDRDFAMPVRIVENPDLEPGRAFIRLGSAEREVDCARLLTQLAEAAGATLHQINEEVRNG